MAVDFSKGAEAVAQRMINAENNMISNLMDLGGLSRNEAEKAFAKLKSVGAFKMDAVNGRYIVKHGAYMERDVIRRAAGRADSIEARLDSLVETVNSLGKRVVARVDASERSDGLLTPQQQDRYEELLAKHSRKALTPQERDEFDELKGKKGRKDADTRSITHDGRLYVATGKTKGDKIEYEHPANNGKTMTVWLTEKEAKAKA